MRFGGPLSPDRKLQTSNGISAVTVAVLACLGLLCGCGEIKGATDYLISGNEAVQRNDYKQAEIEYSKALKLEPNSAIALNNLGVVFNELHDYNQAVSVLNRAIVVDPKNVIAHYTLAQALIKQGKFAEAIARAREAVELDNSDLAAHRALAQAALLQATNDKSKDDLKLALEEYHYILQADSDDDQAHHYLGQALALQDDAAGAIAEQKKAIELNVDNLPAHKALALLLRDKGEREEAQKQLDIVIQKDPADVEARTMRAAL